MLVLVMDQVQESDHELIPGTTQGCGEPRFFTMGKSYLIKPTPDTMITSLLTKLIVGLT